jgi:DNA primase
LELKDIIDTVDIVEYIGQYVDLKKEPNGEYIGLSPFKEESVPSFTISPDSGLFYDFSTHKGGNLLNFIQFYHNCNFKTAINILKKYANIDDNYVDTRLNSTKIIKKFKPKNKKTNSEKHTILEKNVMSKYENDKEKLKVWFDEGISYEVMERYQVRYDPFSNRIVFPVRDNNGSIISIKGRTLDPDFKEKGLRKYTHFNSLGQNDFLFGYYEHYQDYLKQKEIILFEAEKSVMICEGWNILNTGALTTSHLDPLQFKILIKLGLPIVFALDKGINIREDKEIMKLKRYLKIYYIEDDNKNGYLNEKDSPVDKGYDIWIKLYEGRKLLN